MGKRAIEIVKETKLDVKHLTDKLNSAYSDEWLAYIQYLVGAQMAVGLGRQGLVEEMEEHAKEELEHAEKLAKRIIQLGGTPIIEPKDWYKYSTCGYLTPSDPRVEVLLAQNIAGERCAINVYNELIKLVKDKDLITYKMLVSILEDEIEHEQDLEDLANDFSCLHKK